MEWIVNSDPLRETWRRIFEFANEDVVVNRIGQLHGAPPDKFTAADYRKQARQVRGALLQAREYFAASAASTTITAANHLYYGMASLCSALMLVHGTGDQSLDVLRRDPSNRHHGLTFAVGNSAARAANGTTLLETSTVTVSERGHFANWYSTLPADGALHGEVRIRARGLTLTSMRVIASEQFHEISRIVGAATSLMDLICCLPDFLQDLK